MNWAQAKTELASREAAFLRSEDVLKAALKRASDVNTEANERRAKAERQLAQVEREVYDNTQARQRAEDALKAVTSAHTQVGGGLQSCV